MVLRSSVTRPEPQTLSCRELEAAEAEAEARKREERRRQERKNRDAFTALLRRHAEEGRLTARMRFKVRQVPVAHKSYGPRVILAHIRCDYSCMRKLHTAALLSCARAYHLCVVSLSRLHRS